METPPSIFLLVVVEVTDHALLPLTQWHLDHHQEEEEEVIMSDGGGGGGDEDDSSQR